MSGDAWGHPEQPAEQRLSVRISPDGMAAWMDVSPLRASPWLGEEEVLEALRQAEVRIDDPVLQRVQALLDRLAREPDPGGEQLVAEGIPPTEGRDAEFISASPGSAAVPQESAPVDYYALTRLHIVRAGDVIGRLVAARPAADGRDVRGRPIKARRAARDIVLDETVRVSPEDGESVVACVAGRVVFDHMRLRIEREVGIRGDIDFETGSVDSPVGIEVAGTIRMHFRVRSGGSIVVGGCIEAAEVIARGDVRVRSGILGRNEGTVTCGGEVSARFCEEAIIRAAGDIVIGRASLNSQLVTRGALRMSGADLIGGLTYAAGGVEVARLGNAAGLPTLVVVGPWPPDLDVSADALARIRRRLEEILAIRDRLLGLLKSPSRMNPAQRARAVHLVSWISSLQRRVEAREPEGRIAGPGGAAREVPTVRVLDEVFENVRIRIGSRLTHFTAPIKGPIRIELRRTGRIREFAAVNLLSGSVTVLTTAHVGRGGGDG